jgi:hypothetical protein
MDGQNLFIFKKKKAVAELTIDHVEKLSHISIRESVLFGLLQK